MDIFSLIFPKSCLGCGREGKYVCNLCVNKIKVMKQICPYCAKASLDGVTHVRCMKKLRINGVFSTWPYAGVVRKAIIKTKFKFAKEIAKELVSYMIIYLKKEPLFPKKSVLTSIPLYFLRENFRGFNQSELIGKILAEEMGWDFTSDILIRKKLRKSQTELKGKERRKNIRGVFSLSPNIEISHYPNIILFDDVYTTGSTLKEAAKVLKRNHAKDVWGLTIAR